MMHNRGFIVNNECLGFGDFPYWHFLVLGVILICVVALVLWIRKNNNSKTSNEALNILKERFAQGEINEDEYLNKKNILSKKSISGSKKKILE